MVQLTFNFGDIINASNLEPQIKEQIQKHSYIPIPERLKYINQLRKSAESLLKQSENINTEVSGNWTYRRQNFANNAQRKKENLIKNATILNRIADLWDNNNCPEILQKIRTAGDLEASYPKDLEKGDSDWYKESHSKRLKKALRIGLKSQSDNKVFENAIKQLSEIIYTPEQEQERQLKEAIKNIRTMNIPGFYPTPDELIDKMINYADLEDNMLLLEPSAGIGSILDRIKEKGLDLNMQAVEQQHSLVEILELKGYKTVCDSIFTDLILPKNHYDRILMNPPFEKGQDIDHVLYCFNNYLKAGGKLVSVMSASVLNNSNKKYKEFREFIEKANGYFIENGQAFKDSFNSTGVSTVLLVLNN